MQIRLLTDLFQSSVYDLQLQSDGLMFIRNDAASFFLPFHQIRHFQTEGRGKALKRFVLETDSDLYEGIFLHDGDADELIRFFREHSGCYTEIFLDAE